MPTKSTDEKRKTASNYQNDIRDARVIANYGDPGLDEDYHFDILSRYVIVMLESVDRIPTNDRWIAMFAVVKRPPHLWIKAEGGMKSSPNAQTRSDAAGNVNVGAANNFSVKAIPRINVPYTMGEIIKVKRCPSISNYQTDSAFFQTDFTVWKENPDLNRHLYGTWHSEGSSLPYFANTPARITGLRQKTLSPMFSNSNKFFNFALTKEQYEAFMLTLRLSESSESSKITSIFEGQWATGTMVYSMNGGYLYFNRSSVTIAASLYEDINIGEKTRSAYNECIPLVVTTPNNFPTPKTRSPGTIEYNPSYSPIQT